MFKLMQLLLVLVLLLLTHEGSAMLFKMDANGKQCISEDAGSEDVIVHATYNVTSVPDPSCKIDIRVRCLAQPCRWVRASPAAATDLQRSWPSGPVGG